jgi:hypothetical protein
MNDGHAQFTMPDGKIVDAPMKAERSGRRQAQPENLGDTPFEVIVVELKHKPAPKPAPKAK